MKKRPLDESVVIVSPFDKATEVHKLQKSITRKVTEDVVKGLFTGAGYLHHVFSPMDDTDNGVPVYKGNFPALRKISRAAGFFGTAYLYSLAAKHGVYWPLCIPTTSNFFSLTSLIAENLSE
jgi:hypothetical protein